MDAMRKQISDSTKKGISFTLAALVTWTMITVVYRTGMEVETKNFVTFFAGGVMFPLSILFSKITGAAWKTEDNPLGSLGLILNIAQLMYFPIIFWAFSQAPNQFLLFYGIITCAHLFPYGWLYQSKTYYGIAPLASAALLLFSGNTSTGSLWIIPLIVMVAMVLLNIGLFYEISNKKTRKKREELWKTKTIH